MKVADLVTFLQTLDQEAELWFADYYYSDREGFRPVSDGEAATIWLNSSIIRPADTEFNNHYEGNIYLVDFDHHP